MKRLNPMFAFVKGLIMKVKRPVMWLALGITGLVCVALNLYVSNIKVDRFDYVETKIIGVVTDIQFKNDKMYLTLKNVSFADDSGELAGASNAYSLLINPKCVCSINVTLDGKTINIGSNVILQGKVSLFEKATNPGQFDMRKYYVSKGCLFSAYSCELIYSDSKRKLFPDIAFKVRQRCSDILDKNLDEKDAGIMKALLLADKNDLDSDVKELYKNAGAGHLLAISGLHISMFAAGILWVLKRTPIKLWMSYLGAVLFLFTYGYIIGFSPSSFRAIVMFTILCLGKIFEKTYDTLTAMAVSALITVLIKPLCTLQTGFIMSYTAILGIAVVTPMFKVFGKKHSSLIESLAGSVSVTLTTLPVMVNTYYRIPLYAIFLNIVLIPGMSFLLAAGLLCLLFGAITDSYLFMGFPGNVNVFSYMIHWILRVYEFVMRIDMRLPFSSVVLGARSVGRCLIYAAVLFACAVGIYQVKLSAYRQRKKLNNKVRLNPAYNDAPEIRSIQKKKVMLISLITILININLFIFLYSKSQNRIEFLDVGQGLCVCVQYNGQIYCYDGGSTDKKDIYKYVIGPYLDYYGIKRVDAWFISHEDADHTNGIIAMFEEGDRDVGELIIPSVLSDKEKMIEIKEKAKRSGCKVIVSNAGDVFTKADYNTELETNDDIVFYILSPELNGKYNPDDSNACSLVVLMKADEASVLLSGDCDSFAQNEIIEFLKDNSNILDSGSIDIYQVAHHGSANNTNELVFLQSINPKISIISCGFNNSYNHPHVETVDNLNEVNTRIFRTDYDGCVSILLD